jgi:hypothetical protein
MTDRRLNLDARISTERWAGIFLDSEDIEFHKPLSVVF